MQFAGSPQAHALGFAALSAMQLGLDREQEAGRWKSFLHHTARGTLTALELLHSDDEVDDDEAVQYDGDEYGLDGLYDEENGDPDPGLDGQDAGP